MISLFIFSDPEAMAQEIARQWCEMAKQKAKEKLKFTIVLSGGQTSSLLIGKLAQPEWRDQTPWEIVHIFFADERCVPPDNEESNYKNIYDNLLRHIPIPEKNIHRIKGEKDPAKETLRYAKEIQHHLKFKKTKFFDWVLLGIGEDGHTASLFPGQKVIKSKNLCETTRHPDTKQIRITMTPAAITKSTRITYHVLGEGKADVIYELTSNSDRRLEYPTSKIQGEWFLDQGAASRLNF